MHKMAENIFDFKFHLSNLDTNTESNCQITANSGFILVYTSLIQMHY